MNRPITGLSIRYIREMNSQDYIRKAAKLAGWLESDEEGEYLQIPAQPFSAYLDEISAACEQYLLDALAAQLVRQVDALPDIFFESDNDGVAFVCSETENIIRYDRFADSQYGGRTLNTIKAIVDSGVLDGG